MHDQLSQFQNRIGQIYTIDHPQRPFPVTLKEVNSLGAEAKSYSLLFESDESEICPQGLYPIKGEGMDTTLFIVPVGQAETSTLYEIIFN